MPPDRDFPLAIGFLGAGQMATALATAWSNAGLLDVARSLASDPFPQARENFTTATGVATTTANAVVAERCDVLVIAVKPQILPALLTELQPVIGERHFVISIAAGVTLATLATGFGAASHLVRVMPNTPCLVGASATGFATRDPQPNNSTELLVQKLFGAVGIAYRVPEHLLDAVTGLSGSGPAFVYMFIEALADGGVKCGLPRATAQSLAAQTVLGAARMVIETGQHPGALKDAVASPAGTTIAGIHALEQAAFRAAAINAVEAATHRTQELGKPK